MTPSATAFFKAKRSSSLALPLIAQSPLKSQMNSTHCRRLFTLVRFYCTSVLSDKPGQYDVGLRLGWVLDLGLAPDHPVSIFSEPSFAMADTPCLISSGGASISYLTHSFLPRIMTSRMGQALWIDRVDFSFLCYSRQLRPGSLSIGHALISWHSLNLTDWSVNCSIAKAS